MLSFSQGEGDELGKPVPLSSSPPSFHPSSLHPSISPPEEFTLKSRPLVIRLGFTALKPRQCTLGCSMLWVLGIPCWRFESVPEFWAPVAAHVPGCPGTGICSDCFSSQFSLPVRNEIFLLIACVRSEAILFALQRFISYINMK